MVKADSRFSPFTAVSLRGGTHKLHELFKPTHEGLDMSMDFFDRIVCRASAEITISGMEIYYAKLWKDSNDDEITIDLPKGYAFESVDEFLWCLATLIEGEYRFEFMDQCSVKPSMFYFKIEGEELDSQIGWCNRMLMLRRRK